MKTALKTPRITDTDLLLFINAAEKKGIEILYDTYAAFLFLAIKRIVPDQKLAEQVLQTTLKKIWRSISDYDIEKERIYTWMINIARKTAFEALAKTTRNYESKSEGVYAGKG
jgi:DNA-directed RNA polymerase specialized sigma24 family protein